MFSDLVQLYQFSPEEPVRGLEDVWTRLRSLLMHWRDFNRTETNVREQQHGMIAAGCFLMPALFSDGAEVSNSSFYVNHQFCYEFRAPEQYYWITADIGRGFTLATVYFPRRRISVSLYPDVINQELLSALQDTAPTVTKQNSGAMSSAGRRLVVTGFSHYMHTLWNELPALGHAISAGLAEKIALAVPYQPFGPIAELFPELSAEVRLLRFDQTLLLNRNARFPVGLGSTTVTRATQVRVRRAALRYADRNTLIARDRFQRKHNPVFWISVKPPGRTCLRQAEFLAQLLVAIRAEYPRAGFVLNGTSAPWDAELNPNYGQWFAAGLTRATDSAREIIDAILAEFPAGLGGAVQVVSGVSVCDEIVWGEAADFYFCHGGTMQNKIGWVHDVPGMIHSTSRFLEMFHARAPYIEDGPECHFLSPGLTVDCEGEASSGFGARRREDNYYFTDPHKVIRETLAAFVRSRRRGEPLPF